MIHTGSLGELKSLIWIVTNWYRTQEYYDSGDGVRHGRVRGVEF